MTGEEQERYAKAVTEAAVAKTKNHILLKLLDGSTEMTAGLISGLATRCADAETRAAAWSPFKVSTS